MTVQRSFSRPRGRGSKETHSEQQKLPFERTWGGKREGAGRKASGRRTGVAHRIRPEHKARFPLHVTLRAGGRAPSLRQQVIFSGVRRALGRASRSWFRVIHFSVQSNHVHLLVEAHDKVSIARGMAGIAVRIARFVNGCLERRGRFWAERYHSRALRTPREVRNGIVYVLMNRLKHAPHARGLDPCSSARWLEGWKVPPALAPPDWDQERVPVQLPRTWLARRGWKRWGLISTSERPNAPSELQS
jgi:REP element-mobilizing transposase RayT